MPASTTEGPSTEGLRAAVPDGVRTVAQVLAKAGFRSWVVGGSVRDELLAALFPELSAPRKNDWDLSTDARPERVKGLFRRVIPTGIQHGTVTVMIGGEGYEVTTLRGDAGYSDGRRPDDVYFVSDLTEDLARRDFTVNAIAYDVLADTLHDPFDGIGDLRRGLLRAVGAPEQRFAEDGLRVLRCARLSATLAMAIEESTRAAIEPSLDSYRKVSAERIRDEWFKAFKAPCPSRAFEVMRDEGMLAITAPELMDLGDVALSGFRGDALTLSLRCVDLLPADPVLRFAGLIHALGARPAPAGGEPDLAARLRLSNADRSRVRVIASHATMPASADGSDADLRRWLREVTPERIEDVFALQTARLEAAQGAAEAELGRLRKFIARARGLLASTPPLTIRDLAVSGADLIQGAGFSPGPDIGRTLALLLEVVLDDPSANTRDGLLERAQRLSDTARE